jgi:hypothetical protein
LPAERMREGIAIVIPNQTATACLSSGWSQLTSCGFGTP